MKAMKVITSIVLVLAMLVMAVTPIAAARATYYLSDLKLAEADTVEEAKKLLTDAGYTVLDKNLNPGGDKAVYLGYKKSTNVDDAITDVRVMNMYGGEISGNNGAVPDGINLKSCYHATDTDLFFPRSVQFAAQKTFQQKFRFKKPAAELIILHTVVLITVKKSPVCAGKITEA